MVMNALKSVAVVVGVFAATAVLQPSRATDVCGAVCDETWTVAGSPYIMTCDVTVVADCTLTVEAGVSVNAQPDCGLEVGGTLNVNGTSGSPVTFTSAAAILDWDGITINGSEASTLDHASIYYARKAVWAGGDASVSLNHVTAEQNARALYVEGDGSPNVSASNCVFAFNGTETEYAIEIKRSEGFPNPSVAINRSTIQYNTGEYDLYTENFETPILAVIDARDNWWGTVDPDAIDARIKDDHSSTYTGDPKVDWCGYLDGPGGSNHRGGICADLVICDETVVWDRTDEPYVLLPNNLYVCPNGTLRVQAGVEFLARPTEEGIGHDSRVIRVDGTLEVNGTPETPVTFDSDTDTPKVGDWGGITIWNDHSGTSNLSNAEVYHGGISISGGGIITLDSVTSKYDEYPLWIEMQGQSVEIQASGCVFTHNDSGGIVINTFVSGGDAEVTITGSEIHSNGGDYDYEITFDYITGGIHDLRGNWWGTTDAEAISQRIFEVADEVRVDWCGWLDGPPPGGSPARDVVCPDLEVCDGTVTWSETDRPYLLTADLEVCPTGTLRIDPGVDVKTIVDDPMVSIYVDGVVDINGTEASRVTFSPDTATPQAGDWRGIWFRGNSEATIEHASITYASRAIVVSGPPTITLDGVAARLGNNGLLVEGDGPPTVHATDCEFTDNQDLGIEVWGPNPEVVVTNSSIHSNLGAYDYYAHTNFSNPDETTLNARANWWGTTDTATIGARIHDHTESTGSPIVDWCAYLDGPGGAAPDVACAGFNICDETVVWSETARPYQLTSDVFVCPTGTLRIEPGVEVRAVKVAPALSIRVEGVLDVNGSSSSPVMFTSDADTPAIGDWTGIRMFGDSTGDIEHATIRYAEYGVDIRFNGQANLTGVTARDNIHGLYVYGTTGSTMTVSDCTFTDNQQIGVYVVGSTNPEVILTNNSIHSNLGSYDLYTNWYAGPDSAVLDARGNFWGGTTAADIAPRIHDRMDENAAPRVDWCGYLDSSGGTAVEEEMHCPELVACDGTEIMDLTDKPYQLVSTIHVCPTGTLQVEPGVEMRAVSTSPKVRMEVEGTLDVNGTEESRVTFTSDEDDPQVSDWEGIRMTDSGFCDIEHASIMYADYGLVQYHSTQATLTGVTAEHNDYGLYVYGADGQSTTVSDSTFTDNQSYGVYLQGNTAETVTLTNNSIHSNLGSYDLVTNWHTDPDTTIQYARGNWWGGTEPDEIASRIFDHLEDDNAPRVDWCGYLDGPDGSTYKDMHCPELVACDGTEIMDLTDRPYQLVSDLYICSTGTLQVQPGVEIRAVSASPSVRVDVKGSLDINGTEESRVTFTSDEDDPQVSDWNGIRMTDFAVCDIEHASISHAEYGVSQYHDTQVTLTGVTAQYNDHGLWVYGAAGQSTNVSRSSFTDNQSNGVYLQANDATEISLTTSSIHSNLGSYDLFANWAADPDTSIIWATDNWWGTTDETIIDSRIHDNKDDDNAPHVHYRAFGDECDWAIGTDLDGDGLADFDDNCPKAPNASQTDTDGDLMGDACDPEPATAPTLSCDGIGDVTDGWLDADGDGWGDPCDHRPLRADAYPGAPELCDGRDNDGDGLLDATEAADADLDENIACGDCDDLVAEVHVCACELCDNVVDDDCDLATDGDDADCTLHASCLILESGSDPRLTVDRDACGAAAVSGPFDVIRGELEQLQIVGTQVDLGRVECVEGNWAWDRATDWSTDPNPLCMDVAARYWLSKNTADPDYGAASSGERRDMMDPNPACP